MSPEENQAAWDAVIMGIAEWTHEDPEKVAAIVGREPPDVEVYEPRPPNTDPGGAS